MREPSVAVQLADGGVDRVPFSRLAVRKRPATAIGSAAPKLGAVFETELDALDLRLLDALQRNARSTLAELGTLVGLKRPAVHERIKRLEQRGYIFGYGARLDLTRLGLGLVALVSVYTRADVDYDRFYRDVSALPEVLVIHSVAGEESFVVKVLTRSTGHLDEFLARLKTIAGISRTKTTVVLSTPFERRDVALERLVEPRPQ